MPKCIVFILKTSKLMGFWLNKLVADDELRIEGDGRRMKRKWKPKVVKKSHLEDSYPVYLQVWGYYQLAMLVTYKKDQIFVKFLYQFHK